MDQVGMSCLKTVTKEFTLESYGKNRTEAVAAVFAKLKKEAYAAVDGLLIHMQPQDVILLGEEEKTQKEVADQIGISQSYISRLEKRIIKKLRGDLERHSG